MCYFSIQLGLSSSQQTFSPSFFRGVGQPWSPSMERLHAPGNGLGLSHHSHLSRLQCSDSWQHLPGGKLLPKDAETVGYTTFVPWDALNFCCQTWKMEVFKRRTRNWVNSQIDIKFFHCKCHHSQFSQEIRFTAEELQFHSPAGSVDSRPSLGECGSWGGWSRRCQECQECRKQIWG